MSIKSESGQSAVHCPVCNMGVSRLYLSRHLSVVHFKFYQFRCGCCEEKSATREEMDIHRETFGHELEPIDTSIENPYLPSIIHQMSSQCVQISDAADQMEKSSRLATALHLNTLAAGMISVDQQFNPTAPVPLSEVCVQTDSFGVQAEVQTDLVAVETRNSSAQTVSIQKEAGQNDMEVPPAPSAPIPTDHNYMGVSTEKADDHVAKVIKQEIIESDLTTDCSTANNRVSSPPAVQRESEDKIDPIPPVSEAPSSQPSSPNGVGKRPRVRYGDSLVCGVCKKEVANEVFPSLFNHAWTHVNFSPFNCSLCDFGAADEHWVELHINGEHSGSPVAATVRFPSGYQISEFCSIWRTMFSTRGGLNLIEELSPEDTMFRLVDKMKLFRQKSHRCARCQKLIGSSLGCKLVSHSELVRHSCTHAENPLDLYTCGVCGKRSDVANRMLNHCQKVHRGKGEPSKQLMKERADLFNSCFDADFVNNHPVNNDDAEDEEIVSRTGSSRRSTATPRNGQGGSKSTSMFKWRPNIFKRPTHGCSLCPHLSLMDRNNLNELADHCWKHTRLWPFTCGLCEFGALRKDLVDSHIESEHSGEGEVVLPTSFSWTSFDSQFFICYHLYLPPPTEWPIDFVLQPYANWLTDNVIPLDSDECSVCREQIRMDSTAVNLSHRMRVEHVYRKHVGFPFSCSHQCGRRSGKRDAIQRHLKTDHYGVGHLVEPSEQRQTQMRRFFELCFNPKQKPLDTRVDVTDHECGLCNATVQVTLNSDPRSFHVWTDHLKTKPFGCSGCHFTTFVCAGAKMHKAKSHKGVEHVVPPTRAVIDQFVQTFRSCFNTDPPVKDVNLLNTADLDISIGDYSETPVTSEEPPVRPNVTYDRVAYDKHCQLNDRCVVLVQRLQTAKRTGGHPVGHSPSVPEVRKVGRPRSLARPIDSPVVSRPPSEISLKRRLESESDCGSPHGNQSSAERRKTRSSRASEDVEETVKVECLEGNSAGKNERVRPADRKRRKIQQLPTTDSRASPKFGFSAPRSFRSDNADRPAGPSWSRSSGPSSTPNRTKAEQLEENIDMILAAESSTSRMSSNTSNVATISPLEYLRVDSDDHGRVGHICSSRCSNNSVIVLID